MSQEQKEKRVETQEDLRREMAVAELAEKVTREQEIQRELNKQIQRIKQGLTITITDEHRQMGIADKLLQTATEEEYKYRLLKMMGFYDQD